MRFIIWVNTILNHIDTRTILPRHKSPCMVYIEPNGMENTNVLEYPYLMDFKNVKSSL